MKDAPKSNFAEGQWSIPFECVAVRNDFLITLQTKAARVFYMLTYGLDLNSTGLLYFVLLWGSYSFNSNPCEIVLLIATLLGLFLLGYRMKFPN